MDKRQAIIILKKYVKYLISQGYIINQAYLFGSFAKNNYNEDSDIDVAIILSKIDNTYEEQIKLMKHRRNFDTRIEPHPIRKSDFNKNSPFANEILKYGLKIL